MIRHLYSLLFYALMPLVMLRLWWRGLKAPAYRSRINERLGRVDTATDKPIIWLHAVSVGETMAASPLIDGLLERYPGHRLWVTTTTPTGSTQLQRLYGGQVSHSYFPYDLPHIITRFLGVLQPAMLIVMETELWPNVYHQCKKNSIPILVANARLSEKSMQGYLKCPSLVSPMLAAVDYVAAQSKTDLLRFQQLGAEGERSGVAGNLKYQQVVPEESREQAAKLKPKLGQRPVWIAASTHRGEDQMVLDIQQVLLKSFPDLLLLIVPRHPERFAEVSELCAQSELGYVRRSLSEVPSQHQAVWLIDSMGELMAMFGLADFAFIGGSLVDTGGHNPLEPAALGVPCITGPHTFNFSDVMETLLSAQAIVQVDTKEALEQAAQQWLESPQQARNIGEAAQQVLLENQGAVNHLLLKVDQLMAAK